jgi:ubiquitin C-terminal hydrolase
MGVLNNDSWNNALIDMSSISAVQQFLIDMFYITSMQTISCSCGKVLSEQIHRDVFLKIPITETGHLCDIIKRLSHDVAEIDFNYEDCKNDSEHQHKAIKNMDITMWPEVLVANITFWHDLQTYKKFKRDINIESITDDVEIGETVYQVFGICFHIGPKSNRGHYISFARNWEQQGWHRYDDHDVELATVDDIKKQFSIDDSHCHSVWYHRRRTVR